MKKFTLLFLALGLTITTFGQTTPIFINPNLSQVPANVAKIAVPFKLSKSLDGSRYIINAPTPSPIKIQKSATRNSERSVYLSTDTTTQIGDTYYDLQTNGSICNRLVENPDGSFSATWTYAPSTDEETNGWPNRGTGYNYYNGSSWEVGLNGTGPTARIESSRTGWPNICDPSSGGEIFVAHNTTVDQLDLVSRPAKGTGSWTENTDTLVSPVKGGCFWPRMVSVGDTIHEIAVTDSPYNGQSQDGAILYSRSNDGGTTWIVKNDTLPGIGASSYEGYGGDDYAITAKGDTVAIVAGGSYNDVVLLKSIDGGQTWAKTVIFHFAIPHYVLDQKTDTGSSTTPAMLQTNDGSLAVLLDNSGAAHVWFGLMYVLSGGGPDSNYYYPATNDLIYWNENTDSLKAIAAAYDGVVDSTLTTSEFAQFNQGLCSWPSACIDDSGHIFVAYSALDGNAVDGTGSLLERHVYLLGSKDGGHTWGLGNNGRGTDVQMDTYSDSTGEGVFAAVARNVTNNNVSLIYQLDYYAGVSTSLSSSGQPNYSNNVGEDNFIMFVQQPTNTLLYGAPLVSGIANIAKSNINVAVYPNPSNGDLNVSFTQYIGQATILVTNILGSTVKQFNNISIADNQVSLNLEDLQSGIYFVRIETAQGIETQKVVITGKN